MSRQTNFLGGEIAPMSWGRNDRPFFSRGLRTMRNFFPTKQHGAAVSRPGSLFINETRNGTTDVRLLPFVYADDSSFCIEMGTFVGVLGETKLYFRFYSNGEQRQADYLHLSAVTTPFTVGARVTGGTSGAFGTVLGVIEGAIQIGAGFGGNFIDGEPLTDDEGGAGTAQGTLVSEPFEIQSSPVAAGLDLRKVKYAQTGALLTLVHPLVRPFELRREADVTTSPFWRIADVAYATPFPFFDPSSPAGGYPVLESPLPVADATHPEKEWTYLCTLTVQRISDGKYFETAGWFIQETWDGDLTHFPAPLATSFICVYPDKAVTIRRGGHLEQAGSAIPFSAPQQNINFPNDEYVDRGMNVYRGRGGLFGFVGTTQSDKFVDVGAEPDYTNPPPWGTDPFAIANDPGAAEFPSAVAYFQDRRFFLTTRRRPAGVWASATGEYSNFDLNTIVHRAGESLFFELAARRFEQGVHLLPHQKLIIGTQSSVWTMAGAGGEPLDFDSVDARVVDEVGMAELAPLAFDDQIIYVRRKGTGVRSLRHNDRYGIYSGNDLSGHADHLFIGDVIVRTQFLGELGGVVVTVAPKQLVDWTYAEDPWGIVWAVRADGALLSLTVGADGEYGWARHDSEPTKLSETFGLEAWGRYLSVCSVPEDVEDAVYQVVSRAFGATGTTTCIERMTSRVRRGNAFDDGCVDCGIVYSGVPALVIDGLDHLEGEDVYVVGQGNAPVGPLEVSGGQITLEEPPTADADGSVTLYIGLLYTCDLELLDAVSADTKMKKKTVTRVGWEVDQTTGIKSGQDFDHLLDTKPNQVSDGFDAPVPDTKLITVTPTRTWGTTGRAVIRQSLPLPVTVVGAIREFEVGG